MSLITTQLCHHSAAANNSRSVLTWITDDRNDASSSSPNQPKLPLLLSASHSMINIYQCHSYTNNNNTDIVWNCCRTLRTRHSDEPPQMIPSNVHNNNNTSTTTTNAVASAKVILTSMVTVKQCQPLNDSTTDTNQKNNWIVCGFSDGTINLWIFIANEWKEFIVHTTNNDTNTNRSITALDAIHIASSSSSSSSILCIVAGSSNGCLVYECEMKSDKAIGNDANNNNNNNTIQPEETMHVLLRAKTVLLDHISISSIYITSSLFVFIGTASPRHNKIHVYNLVVIVSSSAEEEQSATSSSMPCIEYKQCGSLLGHEDWITCMDYWMPNTNNVSTNASSSSSSCYLATGSQDCRIRLWKFRSTTSTTKLNDLTNDTNDDNNKDDTNDKEVDHVNNDDDDAIDDDDDDDEIMKDRHGIDEEDEEGEVRLEIVTTTTTTTGVASTTTNTTTTGITLEALLMGHEESVTAVTWHPHPLPLYGVDRVLLSSSMDRTILLWTESSYHNDGSTTTTNGGGVWTPMTRVGSAGGILGGSIGSSLLGFLNVTVDPIHGTTLIGHAYGGTLHVWSTPTSSTKPFTTTTTTAITGTVPSKSDEEQQQQQVVEQSTLSPTMISVEERASMIKWKAKPCITGHFDGITDLTWDTTGTGRSNDGAFLLTVSNDQTCRLWAPIRTKPPKVGISNNHHEDTLPTIWTELARPQVHGYDIKTIACISTIQNRHRIITGSDEKEIRVFDAPKTTLRILKDAAIGYRDGMDDDDDDELTRVDRAFIPSLGLSNKASAVDAAEEDEAEQEDDGPSNDMNEGEVMNNDGTKRTSNDDGSSASWERMRLPLERDLGAVSLWPEVQKLFGHDTELHCLTSTVESRTAGVTDNNNERQQQEPPMTLVASSAKARDVDAASIRIWDATSSDSIPCIQVLTGGHKSTVATMSFSRSGNMLVSSGKDRRICLWDKTLDQTNGLFARSWYKDLAHKRIVWSIHFCPIDEYVFGSGSRDGCIKIWHVIDHDSSGNSDAKQGREVKEAYSFTSSYIRNDTKKPDSVTAVAFAPVHSFRFEESRDDSYPTELLLAIGLESGRIELWSIPSRAVATGIGQQDQQRIPQLVLPFDESICHVAAVTKLAWRPLTKDQQRMQNTSREHGAFDQEETMDTHRTLHLASGSSDHGCRIFCITVGKK